jgi:hypothetical protein
MDDATRDEIIASVLDPEAFKRLPGARISDLRWEHYVDHLGVPSLRVWVLFTESIHRRPTHDRVAPILSAIHDGLIEARIDLFPYVRFGRVRPS